MVKGTNRGGKRQGAGRPKGSTKTSIIAVQPPTTPIVHNLPFNYHPVCILEALGYSDVKIGEMELMPHRHTIRRWREHPDWQSTVEYYRQQIATDRLRAAKPIAESALIRASASGDIPASKDILDRVDGKPIVRQQREVKGIHKVLWEDVTPDKE